MRVSGVKENCSSPLLFKERLGVVARQVKLEQHTQPPFNPSLKRRENILNTNPRTDTSEGSRKRDGLLGGRPDEHAVLPVSRDISCGLHHHTPLES